MFEAEVVGSGIPLYKRAWGLATVGIATISLEKSVGDRDTVVGWRIVSSAVALQSLVVPAGQSTVILLVYCQ